VLDGFKSIKICYAYEVNGKRVDYMPTNLDSVVPLYESMPGWSSVAGVRRFEDLPKEAKNYINRIETLTQTKVGIISTSPERNDTIIL